ncbi:Palmitoyltransferase AKR1 [Ceratobasidium theobromae]|uniref:Palmitoyltransferase AKR1 n=1 Tax=Ceratobasidium theobromae TaxID=1582974 RepID=A0A5N5QBR8_9AGAM|nr:Palmitoyltransferase AKR1 [Ceratobasidium theobromae]
MNSNHLLNLVEDGSSSLVIRSTVVPTPVDEKQASKPVDLATVSIILCNEGIPRPGTEKATNINLKSGGTSSITPKPKTRFVPASRWIRFQLWFNTYRKFFTFIVLLESAGMIAAGLGHFPYAHENTGGFVIGNILAGVVVRNELFGRLLYLIVNTLFAKWPPLWFRLVCTSVLQHLGGIHSGCSVSAVGWLIYNLVNLFRDRKDIAVGVLAMSVVVLTIVTFVCISAIPWVRNTHHNVFERNHRFFGWSALIATWVYIILENGYRNSRNTFSANSYAFAHHQELWLTLFMAIAVVLPWTYTRKVPVHIEIPSPKVAVLRFDRGMQQGLLGRISRTAILEYHAFGIGKDAKYHYMVCGVQGDFTRGLVNDIPTHIWTREVKFAGVGNTSTLYRRGIRICTGTGIGAALSTCLQSDQWFLIWIGSDVSKTFGSTITELIERGVGERAILWDTKKLGRPKTMELLAEQFYKWNAEVVMITSNWDGNQEMMQGCKQRGIPAFGTLWDF